MSWLHFGTMTWLLLAGDPTVKTPSAPVPAGMHTTIIGAHTFTLPDGLQIDLVAGPPLIERPIHADFDEQGRLYVAESSGSNDPVLKQLQEKPHRVVRLEDTDGDGKFDKRTIFADKLMFPEGMLFHAGSVYVAAPPSIWKLTDKNNDGVADERVEWFKGQTLTNCANDLHGPYLGPDGWIYWCKGAFAKQTYERPGKKPFVTRAAHIFRARPDGTGIEPVMTGGMDNPVELAFTRTGERIFTTTFFQYPAGGKRDGLIHAIYGGVYGKVHDVIEDHPRTGDVLPPMTHLGPAAPAGICRLESGSLHAQYKDNLCVAQFNMHKVSRHVLEQTGATFKTRDFDLLSSDNLDFHPTDVLEDADGSLIVINTGGWYKLCCPSSQLWKPDVLGGIYRIHSVESNRIRIETDYRGIKIPWSDLPPHIDTLDLYGCLGHIINLNSHKISPTIYKRAYRCLAEAGDKWKAVLGADSGVVILENQFATVNVEHKIWSIWAATQANSDRASALIRLALTDRDANVVQAALNSISLRRDGASVPELVKILATGTLNNRRVAAEALGRIGAKVAVPNLLNAAAQNLPREVEHAVTYALIEIADRKQTATGLASNSPQAQRAALIALDQMEHGQLTPQTVGPFLVSREPLLRETAAWVASRHADWGGALTPALRQRLLATNLSPVESQDLVRQLARSSKDAAIQSLLTDTVGIVNTGNRGARILSLQVMEQSGLKSCPDLWSSVLIFALRDKDIEILQHAVSAVRSLPQSKQHWQGLMAALSQIAAQQNYPEQLRLDALAALPGLLPPLDSTNLKFLLQHLRDDLPVMQRLAAVDVLSKAKLTDEQLLELTKSVRTAGPLEIERLLVPFGYSQSDEVSTQLIAALHGTRALVNVRPETLQRLFANRSPAIRQSAEAVIQKLSQSTQQQRAKVESLLALVTKGDSRRGQLVFHSQKAACAACHALGYVGGSLGPDLSRVGKIRTERDLLEAIVYPSASFVRSYEPVTIVTKSGKTHSGLVRKDTAAEVILAINAREELRIPREAIDEIHPGTVSIMPAGLDQQLTPQELADLIVFLKAAK